jgi:hypothetical protein
MEVIIFYVELIVHVMLCYFAEGSCHNIQVTAGLDESTFFITPLQYKAVNICKDLVIKFPMLASELSQQKGMID